MRRYETFIILDPDISEDQRSVVLQRTSDVIKQKDGFLAFIDEWGSRQLAYEIKKKARGYYVRFDFCGNGPVIDEMERNYRIDDRVLKYMTVLTDESPDLESVKEEIALAESEKAKAKEEAAAREKAAAAAKAEAEAKAAAEAQPDAESQADSEPAPEAQPEVEAEAETKAAVVDDSAANAKSEAVAAAPSEAVAEATDEAVAEATDEAVAEATSEPVAEAAAAEPDTGEQTEKAEESEPPEAEPPKDEAVSTDSEEEIK